MGQLRHAKSQNPIMKDVPPWANPLPDGVNIVVSWESTKQFVAIDRELYGAVRLRSGHAMEQGAGRVTATVLFHGARSCRHDRPVGIHAGDAAYYIILPRDVQPCRSEDPESCRLSPCEDTQPGPHRDSNAAYSCHLLCG